MFYQVFSPIMVVLALVYVVWQPIQTRRVREGWKPKKYKGTHEEYVAKYRQQFIVTWATVGIGIVLVAGGLLPLLSDKSVHWWQFLGGVAFLICGAINLWSRHILDSQPSSSTGTFDDDTA